jgi:adenylate cyclase class 2
MKEIEIKFRVENASALAAVLAERGCVLSEIIEQDDRLFLPPGASYPVPPGVPVLRVRQQNGEPSLLTLKASDAGNELSKTEIETTVSDAPAAASIVLEMGYVEVLRIQKKRRKGKVGGTEICVDEVVGLGSFVELEQTVETVAISRIVSS